MKKLNKLKNFLLIMSASFAILWLDQLFLNLANTMSCAIIAIRNCLTLFAPFVRLLSKTSLELLKNDLLFNFFSSSLIYIFALQL